MVKKVINLNGSSKTLVCEADVSLADVLREQLGLTGTKVGCGEGQCGSCSVIMNGKLIKSCITKMKSVPDAAEIVTIEGVGTPDNLHPIQLQEPNQLLTKLGQRLLGLPIREAAPALRPQQQVQRLLGFRLLLQVKISML